MLSPLLKAPASIELEALGSVSLDEQWPALVASMIEQFRGYVGILVPGGTASEFDVLDKIAKDYVYLDQVSGDELLLLCPVAPPSGWAATLADRLVLERDTRTALDRAARELTTLDAMTLRKRIGDVLADGTSELPEGLFLLVFYIDHSKGDLAAWRVPVPRDRIAETVKLLGEEAKRAKADGASPEDFGKSLTGLSYYRLRLAALESIRQAASIAEYVRGLFKKLLG